jgi:hypothetical protein
MAGRTTGGLLSAIKRDVERAGSNRGKIFFVRAGSKARVRFLEDMDDGRIVHMHDRWDPALKVPCKKNRDEDADCPYCEMEGVRSRDMYCWSVWDYEANEVKVFMFPANQCSPVPGLVALYDNYGTICDRDLSISRTGKGTDTTYAIIPLDKSKFRNEKAKKFTDKAFWKIVMDAHPYPDDDEDEDEEEETPRNKSKSSSNKTKTKPKADDGWDDDDDWDDEGGKYDGMSAKELYNECKTRDIEVKPKQDEAYYIKRLEKWDLDHEDDDDDFWDEEDD